MDNALANLVAACLAFVGTHFAMSHPLRAGMVRALGEKGFQGVYTLVSLATLKQQPNTCIAQFAERYAQTLRQRGAEGFRQINPIKRALNQQQGCSLEIRPNDFSP